MNKEWNEDDLLKVRQVLHVHNCEDIEVILIRYTEMIELFSNHFPYWNIRNKVDWSIAVAMAPNWFGEALSTRINNTMLVSALLITVTTAILLAPPQYNIPFVDADSSSNNTRAFFYLCSVANLLFISSIICGVAFVENAMNRAYTEADKMILIARHYYVLNISQTLAIIGAFLFMILVIIPTWTIYKDLDAALMTALMVLFIIILGIIYYQTNTSASNIQYLKTQHFLELVDSNGRLHEQYYPKSADTTPDYFQLMFTGHDSKGNNSASALHKQTKK